MIKRFFKKWPSWNQWKKLPSLLTLKERYFVLGLIILIIASLIVWIVNYRNVNTIAVPKIGGSYTEGIIGSPQYINPILSQTNDADQDIVELVFSGLMKYNSQGSLVPDLAEEYAVGENGKIYDFFLKKNVKWHDNQPFTADDVIFTIKTIQNPDYRSPLYTNWQGVEIEKIDDYTVRFILNNAYAPFSSNATVGIIPKHIWEKVRPLEFFITEANLNPVGTGPYQFKKTDEDKNGSVNTLELEVNKNYYFERPYIDNIIFKFFINEDLLIEAYNRGRIDGLGFISAQNKTKLVSKNRLDFHQLKLPRYFAIFFNQSKSKALSDKTVRLALNYATDKKEIINKVLDGEATPIYTPIPPGVFGHTDKTKIYDFALEHANNLLDAADWKINEETQIREKVLESDEEPTPLKITLVTTEWPELEQVANIIKEQWLKVGAGVDVKILSIAEIQQDYIRPRTYQALLFGEVLGIEPDPFPFWHSSQKRDPGLNLALYQNSDVDKLLESARETFKLEERKEKYKEFQKLVVEDAPVVFLYNPYYLYPVNKKVKGIEVENISIPSKRFSGIENWYIKTKRIKKEE